MNKLRRYFKKMKEGFLTAKANEQFPAYFCANTIFIYCVFIIIYTISAIICIFFEALGNFMIVLSIIFLFVFTLWDRAFSKTIQISARIFDYFFARYGRVVSKDDWKQIKKKNKKSYKFILSKKYFGNCYYVSWILALHIEDAKIMYCSVAAKEGGQTAHAVVVKNNCVYDTNKKKHFDYDEYIKMSKAEVYKIFDKDVYAKKSFFDDIRQDFVDWCAERNVYCDPQ